MLRTMPHGVYECALPGDALGEPYVRVADEDFTIGPASSYVSDGGEGVYLLRGSELVFTRGPRKGEEYTRTGPNQLRRLANNGEPSKLLCTRVRRGAQNPVAERET